MSGLVILPSFLQAILIECLSGARLMPGTEDYIDILADRFFFFSFTTLKMLFHCFPANFVFTETSVVILIIGASIYDMAFFS